jgi:hypothetical protein
MLPAMADERGGATALKGRLADVYVPALVDGALDALSRRLGNRATIDDPVFGRASTLSSIEPLLAGVSGSWRTQGASYRHVSSATGVDRDVSEGVLVLQRGGTTAELPIAVVAERRRLREIELRVYYAAEAPARKGRPPILDGGGDVATPQIVLHVLEALRKGAVERVLAAFEEGSRWIGPTGRSFAKRDGTMAAFIAELGGRLELVPAGAADDGRTCCIEALIVRQRPLHEPEAAALCFERGESGLLRELRLYYEP